MQFLVAVGQPHLPMEKEKQKQLRQKQMGQIFREKQEQEMEGK